jgi:DNA-directed RNA polymerase specialized sigma24 family protein
MSGQLEKAESGFAQILTEARTTADPHPLTTSCHTLVATLPADQAEAITLRVVAELDVGQVAKLMGKRPGTVRVLTQRGLRHLAERLGVGAHLRGVR